MLLEETSSIITAGKVSRVTGLECPLCGAKYNTTEIQTVCTVPACRSALYAVYDLPGNIDPVKLLAKRPADMWRYQEFLPVMAQTNIVTLGEGFTPIIPVKNLATEGNLVLWKDESANPTGSFKSRGMSVAVSKAKELGIKHLVTPTAGNAGGALAAYCARAGIQAHVYMPKLTPKLFKDECRLYGAELIEIDGNIADCGKIAEQQALAHGWFLVATLKEPYRLEGKKTMGYEIAEQLKWQLPDVIFYPTGGGTGLLGIWKAFEEMDKLGWIGSKRPRMVAVQSDKCDGITRAFHQNAQRSEYVDHGFTIANGLRVPKPYADQLILKVLRESNGNAISISDAEMAAAIKEIASKEGMLTAPEGAALWPAFKRLKASGWIRPDDVVLLLNTGSGYKYLENIDDSLSQETDRRTDLENR